MITRSHHRSSVLLETNRFLDTLVPSTSPSAAKINTREQYGELFGVHLAARSLTVRPGEGPALESLGADPEAGAARVPEEDLDAIASTIAEYEYVP